MTRRALVVLVAALFTAPATAAAAVPIKNESVGVVYGSAGYLINRLASGPTDIAYTYGWAGTVPVSGDWDGDGTDGIGIYANGDWYLVNKATNGSPSTNIHLKYGTSADTPFVGDFNGDGKDDIGLYRAGNWSILFSPTDGQVWPTTDLLVLSFGNASDRPVAGDWNGDGTDTVGFFRPSTGQWFLLNRGPTWPSNVLNSPYPDIYATYGGENGDQPVAGDWDGNGQDSLGVFRAASNGTWYLENAMSNGNIGARTTDIQFSDVGSPGMKAIAGDWDGKAPECRDGKDNDEDLLTDWAGGDTGCSSAYDSPEDVTPLLWKADAELPANSEWASMCIGTGNGAPAQETSPWIVRDSNRRAQGLSSYRIEVHDNEGCGGSPSSERAELGQDNPTRAGFDNSTILFHENDLRWFSWQVYLPPEFPSDLPNNNTTWQAIAQWHGRDNTGPPLSMGVNDGEFNLYRSNTNNADDVNNVNTTRVWHQGVKEGRWVRFTMVVKFWPNPNVAFVRLYGDLATQGQTPPPLLFDSAASGVQMWTMKTGSQGTPPVHSRIGIYRGTAVSVTAPTSWLYYDGYTVATTREVAEANAFRPPTP